MTTEMNKTSRTDLFKIDPRAIVVVEGFNCRKNFHDIDKLAAEIKAVGVLNPISVIPFKDENGVEKYRLVDGERRYRAVMKLIDEGEEILRVPAIFLSKSMTEEEMLIQQALRNEGEQFTPYEWGLLAKKLMDKCGLTMKEVSEKLGINIGTISRYLGYLELDPRLSAFLMPIMVTRMPHTRSWNTSVKLWRVRVQRRLACAIVKRVVRLYPLRTAQLSVRDWRNCSVTLRSSKTRTEKSSTLTWLKFSHN